MQAASLLLLGNTYYSPYKNYCERPRCPKTPKFLSFLVSRIVCLAYSTLHFIHWTHTERNPLRQLRDQRTVLQWTSRPSANKDRSSLFLIGGDLGEGTRKHAVTNGKGSHAHCSICRAQSYWFFYSSLFLMWLMFYIISFSKKLFHKRK